MSRGLAQPIGSVPEGAYRRLEWPTMRSMIVRDVELQIYMNINQRRRE